MTLTQDQCSRAHAGLRRAAAAGLTTLLEQHAAFSLIRLGDGEARWMLEMQAREAGTGYKYADAPALSVETARTVNGMEPRHYPRFVAALEEATFLDYCDSIPNVRRYLPKLAFQRNTALYRNASPETSNIIFEWTFYEMGSYLRRHRCLFAGAEAALFEKLWEDTTYRECAAEVLPADARFFFHQLREDGRRYSENLDLIKDDLKRDIAQHGIDTLFLSLGTGAKVLCHELAQELGIRAIDFGSMMRALTYSGSPGYQACRDMHNPFFFRVPPAVFMPALERGHPQLNIVGLTAKLHAQMVLDLHRHEKFVFNTSDGVSGGGLEFSRTNVRWFEESSRYYQGHYRRRALAHPQARCLDADFRHWCRKKGIGWRGKAFLAAVRAKRWLRMPFDLCRLDWGDYPLTAGRALYLFREKFAHGLRVAWFRDLVRPGVLRAPAVADTDDDRCEIHVLTSATDWLNLLWTLHSFYHFSGCRFALCIHDDGSLSETACGHLQTAFPHARLIRRAEADRHVAPLLAGHPRCQSFRMAYKLALKVFDFSAFLETERMLLLDSDILFFAPPAALIALIADPAVRHNSLNKDWDYGYTVERDSLQPVLDFAFPPFINSGLGLIHRGSIRFDWVEEFLALPGIMNHPHQIEQTLIALCSARFGFAMLPPEYDVPPLAPATDSGRVGTPFGVAINQFRSRGS